jgi:nitroimidazol reductase NimA-like FMN-containing flavoprotein (pyridoxamine 5'-phosphate oxidase superfamily)
MRTAFRQKIAPNRQKMQIRAFARCIYWEFRGPIAMPIRWMSEEEAHRFLAQQTEGRLATCDGAGQPYITPLNYLYRDGRIYFHSKLTGRKLDNLAENNRVCFEVSETREISVSNDRACGCATRYSSVLAFGAARVISDNAEKTALLNLLVEKYAAGKAFQPAKEEDSAGCAVVEMLIDEISGKRNVDPE